MSISHTNNASLFDLVKEEDFNALAKNLTSENVGRVDDKGLNLAMWLAIKDHADLIDNLKDLGLDLDVKDHEGRTALMWAAEYGHYDVVAALLINDADPALQNTHGHTALWYAEWEEFDEIAALLKTSLTKQSEAEVKPAS